MLLVLTDGERIGKTTAQIPVISAAWRGQVAWKSRMTTRSSEL